MSKVAEYIELRKVANENAAKAKLIFKDALVEAIKPVFDSDVRIETVSNVYGYTPSFNDGDPCTFRMNIEYSRINGYDSYGGEDNFDRDGDFIGRDETELACSLVYDSMSVFDNYDWERAFNSYGFEVVFTRESDGSIKLTEEDYDCGY